MAIVDMQCEQCTEGDRLLLSVETRNPCNRAFVQYRFWGELEMSARRFWTWRRSTVGGSKIPTTSMSSPYLSLLLTSASVDRLASGHPIRAASRSDARHACGSLKVQSDAQHLCALICHRRGHRESCEKWAILRCPRVRARARTPFIFDL